jgi:predicted transglutaminase-like cysteine proteinase
MPATTGRHLAEFSRGRLFARSTFIVMALAAVLSGTGGLAAQQRPAEDRQTATMPRYFTINQVLAKLDRQNPNAPANDQPTQLAALDLSSPVAAGDARQTTAPPDEPFGLATFRAPEGLLWAKWRKLGVELESEGRVLSQCRADMEHCANPAARKYLVLIEESRRLPDRTKIDRINRAINAAISYASDLDQHGVPDLWTAPLATLSAGRGDCEDYAIAKYVALREAGISSGDLRILLVHDRIAREHHAVTGVRQNGQWLILDNRHDVLLERKDSWHFTPLFALDQQGVKLFAAPYGKPPTTVPAQVASGPANEAEPASVQQPATPSAEALGLRLDTFDPPQLRGGL